jgi:NAD-reducing hydrogenase large subunit
MDFYDGVLRARDADGKILFDGVSDQRYLEQIEEEVRSWTYMKFPYLRSLGPRRRAGTVSVRSHGCTTAAIIPSARAEAQRQRFVAWAHGEPVHATLAYHWARMIEMLHAMEVIAELLQDDALLGGTLTTSAARAAARPARRGGRDRGTAWHPDPPLR